MNKEDPHKREGEKRLDSVSQFLFRSQYLEIHKEKHLEEFQKKLY
jgi:hypothetical protein